MATSKHYFDAAGKHVGSITTGYIKKYETPGFTSVDNDTPKYPKPIFLRNGAIVEQIQQVSMSQARITLIEKGLIDKIQTTLDSIPDPIERAKAKAWWEYAQVVDRNHPIVQQLVLSLGLNEEGVDALFLYASEV